MNMGSFTFIKEARARGLPISHLREHVDNSAAESVAERGRPKTESMQVLTERRYQRLTDEKIYSEVFRIASVDSDHRRRIVTRWR